MVEFLYARKVSVHARPGEVVLDITDNTGNRFLFSAEPEDTTGSGRLDYYGSLSVPQRDGQPMRRQQRG